MQSVEKFLSRDRRRHRWRKVVRLLSGVVVFCTTYALILPAITMEKTYCGLEAHTHGETCYTQVTSRLRRELVCAAQPHEHTEACYDLEKDLICGKADFVVHTHTDDCYDANGDLRCPLPEIEAHTHDDTCYTLPAPHVHTEDCYTLERGALICGESTEPAHVHTEACYDGQAPTCGTEESEGHVHSDKCYDDAGTIICGLEGSQGHRHDELCFGGELTCGIEDLQAHVHTDDCYEWNKVLTCTLPTDPAEEPVCSCGKEEILLHEHSVEDCFKTDQDGNLCLTCPELQVLEHVHTEDCFQTVEEPVDTEALTCEIAESEEHTHGKLCYGQWILTCTREEHVHTPACGIPPETEPAETTSPEIPADPSAVANLVETDPLAFMLFSANSSINFADDITKVELEYKDGSVWKPVTGSVKPNDQLRFTLSYTLPGNTLTKENRTISYQLPAAFKMIQSEAGKVYNDAGKEVGSYTISQSGLVEIAFNDDYVNNNIDGNAVKGYIRIEAGVDNIQHTGDKIQIDFSDKVNVDVSIHDPQQDRNDLNVTKTASQPDADGNITYTVTIKSQRGTSGPVTLTDVMENLEGFNGEVTVSGSGITDQNPTVTQNGNTFTVQLPQMPEGGEYTLTYSAKLPANAVSSGTAKNTVNVASTSKDGGKLEASDHADTPYDQTYISKAANSQLNGDGTVSWTVTVNQGGHDVSGWTLSDTFNGQPYSGPVTVKDSSGNTVAQNVTLPYQFPAGSRDTYTITYTTPADKPIGGWKPVNKAELKAPDGPTASTGDQYGPTPSDTEFKPLTKEAVGFDTSQDPAIPEWRVTVRADQGPIPANWWYKDTLDNGQYFTPEQLAELQANITAALAGTGLNYTFKTIESGGRTTGFQLDFTTTLATGSAFTFTYHSTAPLGDGNQEKTFTNKGNILDKTYSSGSVTYKPLVRKFDVSRPDGVDTEHNYYDANDETQNGLLKWGVVVSLPKGYRGGPVTVTEILPEGVTLEKLAVKAEGVPNANDCPLAPSGATSYKIWNGQRDDVYTLDAVQSGQTVTITIPAELAQRTELSQFYFTVHARINSDVSWPKDESGKPIGVPFTNKVEVSCGDGGTGSADQTQTILKDDTKPAIAKTHGEYQDNIIPYRITVNPDGEDLVQGGDTLTLTDTLVAKFGTTIDVTFNLVPGSVQVYKLNPDGTKGDPLDRRQFPYTLRSSTEGDAWHLESHYTLEMTLPDRQALLVEYKYRASSTDRNSEWTVSNTAKLEGAGETPGETEDSIKIKVTDSSAGAQTEGLLFTKVDSGNYGITLKGVKFRLYQYTLENGGGYRQVLSDAADGCFTTDSDGLISIRDLIPNTAYYLEEVSPPQGYLAPDGPTYFCITSSNTGDYPPVRPDDFDGEEYAGGESIYLPNEADTTQLQVNKRWLSKDGEDITGTKGGSVSFDLYQMESTQKPVGGGSGGKVDFRWRVIAYGSPVFDKTIEDISVGSTVKITAIPEQDSYSSYPEVTVNEKKLAMVKEPDSGNLSCTFTVTENTNLVITTSEWQFQNERNYSITVTEPEFTAPNPEEDTWIEKFTVSSDSHWQWTSDPLPKTGTNAAGETVYYRYYVKEAEILGADAAYENNGGIVSGTITVRNTVRDDHKMPSTGGAGTALFTVGGSFLLLLSLLLLYIQAKSRRGDPISS